MTRFLIAMFAVSVFSLASVGVAEAGGSGKAGGKNGSIQFQNGSATSSITVFYRPEQSGTPATLGDIAAYPSVTIAPGDSETVSDVKAGNVELAVALSSLINGADPATPVDDKDSGDPGYQVVSVKGGETTVVFVGDDPNAFGGASVNGVGAMME